MNKSYLVINCKCPFQYHRILPNNFYSFGSLLPGRKWEPTSNDKYRFGFNGKEMDDETYGEGNEIAFEARIYDSRLGRFLSCDPLEFDYPWQSTYCFASNNPISLIDHLGMGPEGPGPVKHTVKKGETLWGVAKDHYKKNKDNIGGTWEAYWKNVQGWNKDGDYGKVNGTMVLSDPKKAIYGKGSTFDIMSGGKKVGFVKIEEYSPSNTDAFGNPQPNNMSVNIDVGFKDLSSKLSNFDWIQNVIEINGSNRVQFMDPQRLPGAMRENFYWDGNEIDGNDSKFPMYNAWFHDKPVKVNKGEVRKFYAELTLVARDQSGKYKPILTITYGFNTWPTANGGNGYYMYPIRKQQPSSFQRNAIQNINNSKKPR